MKPDEEISPLLKFYNELREHTNFRLPVHSLLQFDVHMFRTQLEKIKRAHQIQFRYIKQATKRKANQYLMMQFNHAKCFIEDEVKWCI